MAAEADIENAIRVALENAPEPRRLRTWCEKNLNLGIPCKFCKVNGLPCSAFSSALRCKNSECQANSDSCSRYDDELFFRVQEGLPNLAREAFDTALANVRQKTEPTPAGQEIPPTPITLRIRRSPSMKAPYPSPSSSSASDDAIDMVLVPTLVKEKEDLQKKIADIQTVVFARDESIKDLAEKLRRAQNQIKRNLAELESFRRQAIELEETKRKLSEQEALTQSLGSDKGRLEGEVSELQAKVSEFEIENMGGAELFRHLNAQVAALQAEKDTLQTEKDSLTNRMFQDLETVGTERDALSAERDLLLSTVDNLRNEKDNRQAEQDARDRQFLDSLLKIGSLEEALKAEADARQAERDAFTEEKNALLLRMNNVDMKPTPALRSENVNLLREKLAVQAQVVAIQTQYTELQKKYAELQEEKQALKRTANREPIPDPEVQRHQVEGQLQAELRTLQMQYDDMHKDKVAAEARVATLQLQYDTLKEVLGARSAPLNGGRDSDRERTSTSTIPDGAEMARLSEELNRTVDKLAVCKRKLEAVRKHAASVRTSYQRKFVLEHVAVVHLYENLLGALESSSAEHLRKAVKTHVKELRKLKGRLKEETPASVDVIMGMIMKQEEEENVGLLLDDDEDEDVTQDGRGGDDSLDEDDQEEDTRPRKRPRPNPPL